jgi:hypothetical protein
VPFGANNAAVGGTERHDLAVPKSFSSPNASSEKIAPQLTTAA